MQIDHTQEQCHRPGCSCSVPNGDAYCGEHCRNAAEGTAAAGEPSAQCACGHEGCGTGAPAERSAQ